MIAYQIPSSMRAFLASVGTTVERPMIDSLIDSVSDDISEALLDLEELQLIEQIEVDGIRIDAEVVQEVQG